MTDASEKVKELENELGKLTNALKNSESEKARVEDELSSAKEALNQMAKGEEKLNRQVKDLQEDLEVVLSKHKENSGIKEAFAHLNAELESSKKKMKGIEQELQSSVSDSRKFEELHMKSASHLESETERAQGLERLAKEAQGQMASVQEELKGLRAKILDGEKMEALLKSKTMELSAKDSLIDEMYKEVDLLKNSEHQLKSACSELETKLKLSKENFVKADRHSAELTVKKAELEQKLKSFAQLLSESKTSEASALQKSLDFEATKLQLQESEFKLKAVELESKELEPQLTLFESKHGDTDRDLKEHIVKLSQLHSKVKELETEKEQMQGQSSSQKSELDAEIKKLTGRCAEHEGRAAATTERGIELEGLIRSSHSKIEDSDKRVSELEKEIGTLEQKCARTMTESQKYSDKVAELTAELENSRVANAALMRDSDLKLVEHVKNFTNKDSEMKSSYENLELLVEFQKKAYEDKLAEAASKAAALSEELDQASTKGAYLESSIEELKKMLDEAENRAAQSLSENELHIEALAEANMDLNDGLAVSESKLSNLQSKLSQAVAEKDDAVKNLNSSNETVEDITKELASVRQKLQTEMSLIAEQNQHQSGLQTKITQLEEQMMEHQEANKVLKARVKQLEEKLLVTEAELRKEGDNAEVRSREIELDFSSPTKRKSEKSEPSSSSEKRPSSYTETWAKTVEPPFSLSNIKLVLGAAIVSIIIGLILGKRY